MHRREFLVSTLTTVVGLSAGARLVAQGKPGPIDLARLANGKGLEVFNRTAAAITDGSRNGVRLSAADGDGVAYLSGVEFANGTIQVDVRGKDVQQQSFVGIAFHGVDATTYDAVYFRPFNFKTADAARRIRAVQYVSHPAYPWPKLRAEHPGKYEKAVSPVPDPNGWFRARIVVASPKVSVFVDDAAEPSLVVEQLSDRRKGRVGLWVGNTSAGDFANMSITPA